LIRCCFHPKPPLVHGLRPGGRSVRTAVSGR
jgi:hypothetical protein